MKLFGMKRRKAPPPTDRDEFDWTQYHTLYGREILELDREVTTRLQEGRYRVENGHIALSEGALPLNPNHAALYETMLKLAPASVIECGCGGGDHLHNMHLLAPQIDLIGLDRGAGQLDLLKQRNPEIAPFVRLADLTMPYSRTLPKADIAFSQAVIMHIAGGSAHFVALANMMSMANRAILLMENWQRHSFVEDIQTLVDGAMTPWENVHFQVNHFENEGGRSSVLIASPQPIDAYPTLGSYQELLDIC